MYEAVSNKADFPALERGVLRFWEQTDAFRKSLLKREGCEEYVFYDGPPFATGLPHYGHLLPSTIKDIVPRYQSMRGYYIDRRFGWDCHGLPVEYEVEQMLGIDGKSQIEELGIGEFNEKCRSIVLRYTAEWRDTVSRIGRWVDFDRDYKTMDPAYMESIWWVFKSLWDKDLIYEGQKILPYCPRCSTPLSNFEANQGYAEVTDPAITVRFALQGEEDAYFLAWTTTPWTLPSNMALAVGPDVEYARVQEDDAAYYLAKDRLPLYYKSETDYVSLRTVRGKDLVGRRYEPLFPYFAGLRDQSAFRVIAADFVTTDEGTGIVHMAPGFGEDDHLAGLAEGLPVVCPVDAEGRFTGEVSDYAGRRVKDTDEEIMTRLRDERKLVHRSTVLHNYPHCWRCDTPLIYRGVSTWFVKVTDIKDRLLEANRTIRWVPGHLRDGRFGHWLEGARDWAISRNRYWGTPLPVWSSEDGEERICVGSMAELEKLSGCRATDLHKHHVDEIEIPSSTGKGLLRRIPEVLDCWFESGSMPYAQAHYPFENKDRFEAHFPADFIAEGLDQTRGWFYTLMVLSVALFDKPAFKNVVVNGMVLAEDGRKMSKRLKNYPDPVYILDQYGADALRLYLISSPVVRAEDLRFSEAGVKHVLRHWLIPLWNAYSFFVTYANIDGWTTEKMNTVGPSRNVLDRWIRSSLESLADKVTEAMDVYDLQRSVMPFVQFIEDLTNWYIRRSRRRFWKSEDDADKAQAYRTLNYVLLQFSKIAAPFVPFISESIYGNLRTNDMPESVHLCDFPLADGSNRDVLLEEEMATVMTVVRLGRQLRSENELKVRQPLAALHIVSRDPDLRAGLAGYEDIVQEELNVKSVVYGEHETVLVHLRGKANFRTLGPKMGSRVKQAAAAISSLGDDVLEAFISGSPVSVEADGATLELTPDDVLIERVPREGLVAASDGAVVVALETELSGDLIREGLAREFVNKVQNTRKTRELEVTQRIAIEFACDDELAAAVRAHAGYVRAETLGVSCGRLDSAPEGARTWDINGHSATILISPVET